MPRLQGLLRDPRALLSGLVLAGYVGVSQGVVNLYPFSTFEMYSRAQTSGSRLGARASGGEVVEVSRFERYRCAGAIDVRPSACGDRAPFAYTPYLDDELAGYVRAHAAGSEPTPDAQPVEVVRRIYRFDDPSAPPRIEDCVLAECQGQAVAP